MMKKGMVFKSVDSLQQVVNVVNEASAALGDETRTIRESSIPGVLTGALGAGVGGVGSFAALYGLGTVGLSAAGITSGLATAGGIIAGGWQPEYLCWLRPLQDAWLLGSEWHLPLRESSFVRREAVYAWRRRKNRKRSPGNWKRRRMRIRSGSNICKV